jgi:hypothetical protein
VAPVFFIVTGLRPAERGRFYAAACATNPGAAPESFHFGSAQGPTSNRLNAAFGAISLRIRTDLETVRQAFDCRF